MKIDYQWKILELERDAATGAVIRIHWDCTGIDEESSISHRLYGAEDFNANVDDPSFVPFENLTEEIVLTWLWNPSKIDKAEIETKIATIINQELNPVIISGKPW